MSLLGYDSTGSGSINGLIQMSANDMYSDDTYINYSTSPLNVGDELLRLQGEIDAIETELITIGSGYYGIYASTNKIYSDAVNDLAIIEGEKRFSYALGRTGIDESFPMDSSGTHPHSPYGVSKAAGDLLTQEFFHAFGVPTVVLRMSCIYGLYQNGVSEQGWTDFFVRQRVLGDNKLIFYGNGKQVRDCLFGSDAAEAYLTCLKQIDKAKGKVYNLGGGEFNTSLIEWVDILNTYMTKEGDMQPMQISYEDWRLADHRIYISDTSKIQEELGWKPKIDIETGIKKMVEAYRGDFYKI